MRDMTFEFKYCPACGGEMNHPFVALSRRDNKTIVCSECGQREAWEDTESYAKKEWEKHVADNSKKV